MLHFDEILKAKKLFDLKDDSEQRLFLRTYFEGELPYDYIEYRNMLFKILFGARAHEAYDRLNKNEF